MTTIPTSLFHLVVQPRTGPPPHPTVVLLHGRGSDENDLLGLASALDPRLLVISVRAPIRFPYGGYTWYELLEIGKPRLDEFMESCRLLSRFISEVKLAYPVDPGRLFLFGFSMGSMMSFALALSQPEEIRGVIAHSGYVPEGSTLQYRWRELEKTAFFVAHGTNDPVVPVSLGRRAHELLETSNAPHQYREYPIQHTISDESLEDALRWMAPLIDSV